MMGFIIYLFRRNKLVTGLSLFWLLSISGYAIAEGQPPGPRQRLLIDEGWRFSQEDTAGADAPTFDDSRWRKVDLPHDWSIEHAFVQDAATGGGGGYLPTGVGWYRRHLALPGAVKGKVVWIEFEGVYQNSDVWVNGHHLGHYPNGYMSFWYDLSKYVKAGDNIIAVRVDNSRQPNTRYYSGSGIYRHVWLTITGPLHIAEWGTYVACPEVDPTKALVLIRTEINDAQAVGRTGVPARMEAGAILRSTLLDPFGKEVGRMESAIGKSTEVEQKMSLPSPSRWSLEDPVLYTLRSAIIVKGKLVDETSTPFGIRTIRYTADSGFQLNGKRIKMNGVCVHHDAGGLGAAVPEAVWVRRLRLLKEMGCNAIRTSHGPVAPAFLDLCDRMGFLVMDEFLDEWKSAKVKFGYSNYFDEWSQKDLDGFIHRDRNHPSIVMWSAGNEIGEQKQPMGVEVLRPLIETFHREDPTRPVTTGNDNIAADNGSATLPFLNMLDIVGYNYVDRWHERRELFYDIDRHDHPGWKVVGTESVAIPGVRGNYFGGNFSGRSYQIDSSAVRPANMPALIRVEQLWKFVATHDYVIGDFMWTGIDYLGEARWPARSASSGVIDLCGFPKDAYYFYQSRWTEKPMLHLFPHWNWKGKEGQVIPVMVYTNCDSVELFVNGKSWGMKAMEFPRQGNSGSWNHYASPPVYATTGDLHLRWDVPYAPGVLRVVGRKGGHVACEEEVRTTGEPAAIRLSEDRDSTGSGRDVAQVRIEVTDANGLVVPDAGNSVELRVEGEGKLIAYDNGNPVDHESMKSNRRNVFNGLALATLQSGGHAGQIILHASSPGLRKADLIVLTTAESAGHLERGPNTVAGPGEEPREILLWPNGAPGSEGKLDAEKVRIAETGDHVISGIHHPSITPFIPATGKATGTAIIIAPGGGHTELWIDHEGYNPANWFQARGVAAFVLKYRLAREQGSTYTVDREELADIQRAIRLVRSRAAEWGIDTARIGVMGFSAGGELAGLSAMRFDAGDPAAHDPVDRFGSRPAFQALIYPGHSERFEVASHAPPVFLVAGYQDRPDISEGIAGVYLKYKKAGIPAELHIYSNIGHGFGMRATNKGGFAEWPSRLYDWLSDMGFLN